MLCRCTTSWVYCLLAAWVPSVALADTYSDLIMSHGPVAYWRLAEQSGTTAAEETGNFPGIYHGPLLGQEGPMRAEKAPYFDGVDDYVAVGSPTVSGSSLTLLAWIKADAFPANDFRLLSKKKVWTVLLVVADAATPSTQEAARKGLMESWGYQVNLISDDDTQINFNTAAASADAAYVSSTVSDTALGTKLKAATIGVVNEKLELIDDFGIAGNIQNKSRNSVRILNNSHYITSGASVGATVQLTTSLQPYTLLDSNLAPGLVKLTETFNTGSGYKDSFAVLNPGSSLYGGGTAAGRRVSMPWGGSDFDISALNATGLLYLQRSVAWAARRESSTAEIDRHWWTLGVSVSGGNAYLDVYLKSGGATVQLTDTTQPLLPSKWVLAAAVYNGSTLKLYKNGVAVASRNQSGALDASSGVPVWIGDQPERAAGTVWGKPALGIVDEVAIFNSALTPEQLELIYKTGRVRGVRILKWVETS